MTEKRKCKHDFADVYSIRYAHHTDGVDLQNLKVCTSCLKLVCMSSLDTIDLELKQKQY